MTSIYYIYPGIMTEANVSAIVGMSATAGECPRQRGKCPQKWGNVRNNEGNVFNSGEIEHGLRNLREEMVIHNCA